MSRFMRKNEKTQTRTQENLGHARSDSLHLADALGDDSPRDTERVSKKGSYMPCKFHSGRLIAKVCELIIYPNLTLSTE